MTKTTTQEEIRIAVLEEKVRRLESMVYGGGVMLAMNIIGLFAYWIKDIIRR